MKWYSFFLYFNLIAFKSLTIGTLLLVMLSLCVKQGSNSQQDMYIDQQTADWRWTVPGILSLETYLLIDFLSVCLLQLYCFSSALFLFKHRGNNIMFLHKRCLLSWCSQKVTVNRSLVNEQEVWQNCICDFLATNVSAGICSTTNCRRELFPEEKTKHKSFSIAIV